MARHKQRVRAEFLVALTAVVIIYGGVLLLRHYSGRRREEELQPLERQLASSMAEQQSRLTGEARKPASRSQRNAAALAVQLRRLMAQEPRPSRDELDTFLTRYNRWQNGKEPGFPRGKPFLRGYVDHRDGSFRPYRITVPEGYSGEQPTALILSLPGHSEQAAGDPGDITAYPGAIRAVPATTHQHGPASLGDGYLLAIVEDVRALYNIDPVRIYLSGQGMGGTVAWLMAARYPHLFRGVLALGAPVTRHTEARPGPDQPAPDFADAALRDFLHATRWPLAYGPNLTRTPAAVLHATGDSLVPVEHSRRMVSELRRLGASPYYREFPGARHGALPDWAREDAMGWIFGRMATGTPESFSYRTASLWHNRAWWLRLDRLGHPLRFGEVSARVEGGTVAIQPTNVEALTVLLDELPEGVQTIRLGEAEFPVASAEGTMSLRRSGGRWEAAEPPRQGKRRGMSGPFSAAFHDQFVVVYGTGGDSRLMRTVCRREAQRFQRHWQSRHGAAPRVVRDADLTERERTEAHLVLIGGPDVNSVTARLAPELPVDLRANSFRFAGRTYDGTSQGILMCYPSPYAPRRLIALAHGNSPAAVYQCLNRFGLWLEGAGPERNEWFDFGVFDAHTADPESFLHVGFFDNDWQLPDPENAPGGWSRRRGTVDRIDYRPQGFPAALTTTQARRALPVAGGPVYLTDLMPELINQPAGAVGFDRAFTGERLRVGGAPFDKGLGVKVPSEIVYHVGGVFSRFSSTVALTEGFKGQPDPVRKRHEKVVFEVWGDGELLTRSPALSWSDEGIAATRIHADVEGIFTLRLVVRPEGNAPPWLYGAASWCAPAIRR